MVIRGIDRRNYAPSHWALLRRFAKGDEGDPTNQFNLADDVWDARGYASNVYPPHVKLYEFSFTNLRSWIKLYVKLYCYERLMGRKGNHSRRDAKLAYHMKRADQFILDHTLHSIDDLADTSIFERLWDAQLIHADANSEPMMTADVVRVQKRTRAFWLYISSVFGVPLFVPPVAPHAVPPLSTIGVDSSKHIPDAVVRQLVNVLALHRDGISLLNRHPHLRLCILLLQICVGRRIEEVLAAPRGEGPCGPLKYYPCRQATEDGPAKALWFRYAPNKRETSEWVYISPEWESLATYCVRQLISYGDEVRRLAPPSEQGLLILVSKLNLTAYAHSSKPVNVVSIEPGEAADGKDAVARGLNFVEFNRWLNGFNDVRKRYPGFLDQWNITYDGSDESQAFHLKTSYARHTRQSVLAGDPQITALARQRDLNHDCRDAQFSYQHVLDEENKVLTTKVMNGSLSGRSMKSLDELLGILPEESGDDQPALVTILSPRLEALIENNPAYFERNRVELGVCGDSEGSDGCELYKARPKSRKSQTGRENAGNSRTANRDRNAGEGASSRNLPLQNSPLNGSRGRDEEVNETSAVVNRLKNRIEAIREGEL
jgi:hypothetical protein